jgi:hypothetical protein
MFNDLGEYDNVPFGQPFRHRLAKRLEVEIDVPVIR